MDCELCESKESNKFVILPITQKGGKLDTISCLKCARKNPAYCRKHYRPHLGFGDGSTACMLCIEKMISKIIQRGNSDIIIDRLMEGLSLIQRLRLEIWARDAATVTIDLSTKTCILRALTIRAFREKMGIIEVVDTIIKEKSVSKILPFWY